MPPRACSPRDEVKREERKEATRIDPGRVVRSTPSPDPIRDVHCLFHQILNPGMQGCITPGIQCFEPVSLSLVAYIAEAELFPRLDFFVPWIPISARNRFPLEYPRTGFIEFLSPTPGRATLHVEASSAIPAPNDTHLLQVSSPTRGTGKCDLPEYKYYFLLLF
jgi:hypothetical protein